MSPGLLFVNLLTTTARLLARTRPMFGKPKNPESHRYYLLPGQGRGARLKRKRHLIAALVVGLVFSGLLAGLMWLINRR